MHGSASDGTAAPYVSALDLGGGAPGSTAEAPSGDAAAVDKIAKPASPDRANLSEEVVIALLDAQGPISAAEIQEQVNAKPDAGSYVTLGMTEKVLLDFEGAGKVRRIGAGWELVGVARAEYETPAKVVLRRSEIVATLLLATFPNDNNFDRLTGVTLVDLAEVMRGREDSDEPSGAITATGFAPRYFPVDVLAADLAALVSIGVLATRTTEDEEKARADDWSFLDREEEALPGEPADLGDGPALDEPPTDAGDEGDADEETIDVEPGEPEPASTAGPVAYVFAPGAALSLLSIGALALVHPSVPAAAPLVAAAAADGATTADRTRFEEAATAKANAYLERATKAERTLAQIRTHLATKRLEHLVDEAMGPREPPVDPALRYFDHTQTVRIDDREKAVILDEIGEIDEQIAEEESRIEGAKLAASSAKTTGKEKLVELREMRAGLMAAKDLPERTYAVIAYSKLLPEGDEESGGSAVNLILAKDGGRVLKREVLTPREVAKAAFDAGAKPDRDPQLSLGDALAKAAETPGPDGKVETFNGIPVVHITSTGRGTPVLSGTAPGSTFDVTLTDAGSDKIAVVRLVKEIASLSTLKAAKDLVEHLPAVVKICTSMEEADGVEARLKSAGATCKVALSPSAPTSDAASQASESTATDKAARAAAIVTAGKVELSPAGLRPHVLTAIVESGEAGLGKDVLGAAVCKSTGIAESVGLLALIQIVTNMLSKGAGASIIAADGGFRFAAKPAVIALVAEAGDTGLRDLDLDDAFTAKHEVTITPAIHVVLAEATDAAVLSDDLSRGAHASGGNLLWLAGQTDPRRGENSDAKTEATPVKGGRKDKTPTKARAGKK